MDVESETESEDYLVITTKKDRIKLFCKLYWRVLVIIGAVITLFPIACLGENSSYPCLYIFLITYICWIFDILHPAVVSLIPIGLFTMFGFYFRHFIGELRIHDGVLNCLGVMMMIVAIEYSKIHRRVALKLLLIFGCSHYRLSFLLFFTCMFLSMWVTNTMACGLMIPIVKAILNELEKMGILEVYHNISKGREERYNRHEQSKPIPTDFTIFYFLGIAYSSSIGGLATLIGSQTNELFRFYTETIFPYAPKLLFPHFMLLNLPGVLVMETLLYLWMNFYFMGMFRAQSEIALEIGMTEEEAEYIQTLLSTQYNQLGKISFHEGIVTAIVFLTILLQISRTGINNHTTVSSPIIFCVVLFFIIPINLDFLKFFKKRSEEMTHDPYPTGPSKACLNWNLVRDNVRWTVVLVAAGCCSMFEAMRTSSLFEEMDKLMLLMKTWPAPIQALMVILLCKMLTEFANNSCVLFAMLPSVARLSVTAKVNPHYLMSAASISSALPFHMITGSPANALVLEYLHIHPWKMMHAGLGPSLIAICVTWFTVTLWSQTLWPNVTEYPGWADKHKMQEFSMLFRSSGYHIPLSKFIYSF